MECDGVCSVPSGEHVQHRTVRAVPSRCFLSFVICHTSFHRRTEKTSSNIAHHIGTALINLSRCWHVFNDITSHQILDTADHDW